MRWSRGMLRGLGALLLLSALAATACDDTVVTADPERTDIDLNGFWEGSTSDGRLEFTLQHDTITEDVRGFGTFVPRTSGSSRAFRVEGLVDDARDIVTLLLEMSTPTLGGETGVTLVHYRAEPFGRDQLQGLLNGGGFSDAQLSLRRLVGGIATTGG